MNGRQGAVLLLVLSVAGGCITTRGPRELQHEVGRLLNVELQPRAALSMDTLALVLAPFPAAMSGSMWHIQWFHAGTYHLGHPASPRTVPPRLREFALDGWQRQMYAREFPREVLALIRKNGNAVRDLAVVIQDGQELTIVRLTGRIDRFLADRAGNEELMSAIEAMHTLFEHLGMAQSVLKDTAEAHRTNEARVRSVLEESGWLVPPGGGREPTATQPPTVQGLGELP